MNHLQELLEQKPNDVFRSKLLEPAVALQLHDEFCRVANSAICFSMGDVERLGDVKAIEELSMFPPFQTCWFETAVDDRSGPPLMLGFLVHTKTDSTLRVFAYQRLGRRWSMASVAEMEGLWTQRFIVTPNCDNAASQIQMARELICVFLSAMNCINVGRQEHHPDPKLQKARAKRGKAPLFSYWTLQISGKRNLGASLGGTHASPRVHLRRGHPMKTAKGNWTWRQAHAVGNRAAGIVHKDYAWSPNEART